MEAVKGVFPWMSLGRNTIMSHVNFVIVSAIVVKCDLLEWSPNKVDPNLSCQYINFTLATLDQRHLRFSLYLQLPVLKNTSISGSGGERYKSRSAETVLSYGFLKKICRSMKSA